MIPTRNQYKKWSLPSKWSFWAAIISIPLSIISLLISFIPTPIQDHDIRDRNRLLLQVAQELRNNNEWLTSLAIALERKSPSLPVGSLKTEALLTLVQREYDLAVQDAYGEEKYIYQHVLLLYDLGKLLGSPKSSAALNKSLLSSEYSLHDIHFLSNFLFWYVTPLISETLSETQLHSLGWYGFPSDQFKIKGLHALKMKYFADDGEPIMDYVSYLGLID